MLLWCKRITLFTLYFGSYLLFHPPFLVSGRAHPPTALPIETARTDTLDNPIPNVACTLDNDNGYNSPMVTSNLLQFDYTSPEYPAPINDATSGLCILRIDHDWKFGPRTSTSSNSSSDSTSIDEAISDEQFYNELCQSSSVSSGGGGNGGNGENPTEGGENEHEGIQDRKPKICQVKRRAITTNITICYYNSFAIIYIQT